ncbi:MAG: RelA/SpoT domain-containing protein [Eubacteriales bacterium]|nr:RelA/SpoT domain-containing protein [Eubacteriales bacterium]
MQIIYCHVKKTAGINAIVAQRLKRLQSITNKLNRFPNMGLCTMQDIGGCRVIVSSIEEAYKIIGKLKKSSMRHKLREEYDYIKSPKEEGYRSYHITYSYHSDRNEKYNGLFIEIQVRTHIQHLWATAVETMDIFTGESLKNGFGSETNS